MSDGLWHLGTAAIRKWSSYGHRHTASLCRRRATPPPGSAEVCPVCDIPDVRHDTSLLRQPSLLLGRRRLSEKDLLSVLVDAHRFFG